MPAKYKCELRNKFANQFYYAATLCHPSQNLPLSGWSSGGVRDFNGGEATSKRTYTVKI